MARSGLRTAAILAAVTALFVSRPVPASADPAAQCSGPTCSGACAAFAGGSAQERLVELVDRQRDELVSLSRTLASERRRQARLESELAVARAAARGPAAVEPSGGGALADENRRLRLLLEVEREERERLAAKLRTAQRVADLVFRAEEAPPPPVEEEVARPRFQAPEEPSPERSTVWTREAMGY
jgi:hypothetical protein